jgi:predicted RNase H-like nuclease
VVFGDIHRYVAQCREELARLMSRRIRKDLRLVSDDQADAWIAWYLARSWLDGRGVMLVGNLRTGSFVVPDEPLVQNKFADENGVI